MSFSSSSMGDLQKLGVKNRANGQHPPTQLTSSAILHFWAAGAFPSQKFLLREVPATEDSRWSCNGFSFS